MVIAKCSSSKVAPKSKGTNTILAANDIIMKQIFIAALVITCTTVLFSCGSSKPVVKSPTTVLLDNFFNNEYKTENGKQVGWHYLWNDTSMGGFSQLGVLFQKEGAVLETLKDAPTLATLSGAGIYIIADPDNEKETATPNFMNETYASNIATWVKNGGVLVLLANDVTNCELDKFNILSQKFGISFNKDNKLVVQDPHFEQGEVKVEPGNPIFKTAANVYIKGICSVTADTPAKVVLKTNNFDVMAVAKFGKGTVFGLGDPWIYNEYIGHARLPQKFENDKASQDWVKWLLKQ